MESKKEKPNAGNDGPSTNNADLTANKIGSSDSISNQEEEIIEPESEDFPDEVFSIFPPEFQRFFNGFPKGFQRDLVMLGTLPILAGAMPNVSMDHTDGEICPLFYNVIVANAGEGKGRVKWAYRLGEQLHQDFISSTNGQNGQMVIAPFSNKIPKFFLGQDNSRAGLVEDLTINNGEGVVWNTEIDTLTYSQKNEWGLLGDIIRMGFQQERITVSRVGRDFEIANPRFSMLITGTPSQVKALIPSKESGLFSRISFYHFSTDDEWRSQRPYSEKTEMEELIVEIGTSLIELQTALRNRETPLKVTVSDELWGLHDSAFRKLLKSSKYDSACVKRSGLQALRFAMTLEVINAFYSEEDFAELESLEMTEESLKAGIELEKVHLEHSDIIGEIIPDAEIAINNKPLEQLLQKLPDDFTRDDIRSIMGDEYKSRKVSRWLNKLETDKYIKKIEHGHYEKIQMS